MSLRAVLGQKKALHLLLNTLKTGRVPSALLFTGEPGIGKRYTAFNYAKALNCVTLSDDSCDSCPSCKKIDSGIHPDVISIGPERGEIRIEEIRSIEEALSFRPFEGKRKVVIIDEAEKMNQSASNAFLKTLEEPPPGSVIIMITSSPDALLPTIRSRCCKVDFSPIPERDAESIIRKILPENYDLKTFVRISMGRPGLITSSDSFRERERLFSIMVAMLEGNHQPSKDREELEVFIEYLIPIIRDMAVYKVCYDEETLLNKDIEGFVKEIARRTTIRDIIETYERLLLLRRRLGLNLNIGITWNYIFCIIRNLMKGG